MITEHYKDFIRDTASIAGLDVSKSLKVSRNGSLLAAFDTDKDLLEYMLTVKKSASTTHSEYVFKTKPYDHQRVGFELSKDKEFFALLMEMQTGKSKVAIDTAGYLFQTGSITGVLVVAPNGVHRKWVNDEVASHLPDDIPVDTVYWKKSQSKSFLQGLNYVSVPDPGKLKILSMNFEALTTDKGFSIAERFVQQHQVLFIVDEGHFIKNPQAKRTKAVMKLGKKSDYRRLLTGTPVTQSPLDVWSQFQFLSPDILGCPSYHAFKAVYANMQRKQVNKDRFVNVIIGYKNLERLSEKIKPYSYRVLKKDCLDLPPQTYRTEVVELSKDQKRLYSQLSSELIAELDGEFMTAEIALVKYLRLQQIIGGFWKPDDSDPCAVPGPNPKLQRLLHILDEIDPSSGVIIWSRFTAEIKMITQELEKIYGTESVVTYFGGVSSEEKQNAVSRFQSGESRFFVGNQRAGGIGLTLHKASYMIYFSNDFSMSVREQADARFYGIGQTKNTAYIELIARDTLDEVVLDALKNKKEIADLVTQDHKALLRKT